jgi:transcriptional regulator with XRE-family HTH domain
VRPTTWGDEEKAAVMGITPQRYRELTGATDVVAEKTSDGFAFPFPLPNRPPYLISVVFMGIANPPYLIASNITNNGFVIKRLEPQSPSSLILDLHNRSGLTWEELSQLFGCDRRTLHLWARGSRPSEENESRLRQIAELVRQRDAGSPESTRKRFFLETEGSASLFSTLARSARPDSKRKLLRRAQPSRDDVRRIRPSDLVGALDDNLTLARGHLAAAKPLRRRQR